MAERINLLGPGQVAAASGIWHNTSEYHPEKSLYFDGLPATDTVQVWAANGPKPSSSVSGSLVATIAGGTSPQFLSTGVIATQFDWLIANKTAAAGGGSTSVILSAQIRRQ